MSIDSMTNDAIKRMYPDLGGKVPRNYDGINGMTDRAIEQMDGPWVPPGSCNDAFVGSLPENPGIMNRPLTTDAVPKPGSEMTIGHNMKDGLKGLALAGAAFAAIACPGPALAAGAATVIGGLSWGAWGLVGCAGVAVTLSSLCSQNLSFQKSERHTSTEAAPPHRYNEYKAFRQSEMW